MMLSVPQLTKIHTLHSQGAPQRTISVETNHALGTVNKYVRLFKLLSADHPQLYQLHCRYLLADNAYLTTNELQLYFKQELGSKLSKYKTEEILSLEKNRLSKKYLDLCYQPGQVVQFDWGTTLLQIGEHKRRICIAVFAFPYSNYRFYYITKSMTSDSFLEAFTAFVQHIGGVCPTLVIDNMRIAIQYQQKTRHLTPLFEQLQMHYNLEVLPCTPYRPNQKGTVENAVRTVKTFLKTFIKPVQSIGHLQQTIQQWNTQLNQKRHHEKNDTISNLHKQEKVNLNPLPKKSFVYYRSKICKVTKNGMIRFFTNTYSIPEEYSGKMVEVCYSDKTIYIKNQDGHILAKYTRDYHKYQKHYRIWHMLHKIKTKAPGFINSQEYRLMPKYLKLLHYKLCENHTHFFVRILESFQYQPHKALQEFIFTLHQENITYEQLKDVLQLE